MPPRRDGSESGEALETLFPLAPPALNDGPIRVGLVVVVLTPLIHAVSCETAGEDLRFPVLLQRGLILLCPEGFSRRADPDHRECVRIALHVPRDPVSDFHLAHFQLHAIPP